MRILIADDHLIFAQSLASLLVTVEGLEVVGVVANGKLALQKLATENVDVMLSDLQMPEMSGIELTFKIRHRFPTVKVMILSMVEEASLIREAIRAGAAGFGSKNMDKNELERALKMIADGETYLSSDILHELTRTTSVTSDEMRPEMTVLSEREIEILRLIAKEMNSQEIAEHLFVSVNTVSSNVMIVVQNTLYHEATFCDLYQETAFLVLVSKAFNDYCIE